MRAIINKMTDDDVFDKVDTEYIAEQFLNLENLGVTFVCTNDDRYRRGDDWIDAVGMRHIVIKLPYKTVKRSSDIRSMMLEKLQKRLGQVA